MNLSTKNKIHRHREQTCGCQGKGREGVGWTEFRVSRCKLGFPDGAVVKNPPANAGDARNVGLIPGSGRSPAGGTGNPLQYSCLENSIDRGAWWATIHGVTKSWIRLSREQNITQV